MSKETYQDYWGVELAEVDPDIHQLIAYERERQARRIIFIPSESFGPLSVRQALASEFSNVYAEGYPSLRMLREDEDQLWDYARQLARYRRYADRRFYKGTDYVDILECVAQRRCAELFATERVAAQDIHVNVQPLSGAAANLAIYEAFLDVGDTMMGMDLFQGGHLSHGSPFNISGKRYDVVSYGVDPETERLDYDAIMALAVEHRPKLIVAGFTSYPWSPDWPKFRQIADACGAILMADIAHIAGLISAGAVPSPIGYADVISFTTHKTMCGPRGAVIMTTNRAKAAKVNTAIFPGEQGGPHTQKFAAMAVAFKIAAAPAFKRLQRQIVENAVALGEGLSSRGLRLAYGGTDTHMLLIDLAAIKTDTGVKLRGEPAVRIMELCGMVANKNTIPGDTVTALASGVRLGTPWCTQRGMGAAEMDRLASLLHQLLTNIHPFEYVMSRRRLPRGKVDLEVLEAVKRGVAALADAAYAETPAQGLGYPHYSLLPLAPRYAQMPPDATVVLNAAEQGAVCLDLSGMALYEVRGERAKRFVQQVTTNSYSDMLPGQAKRTFILGRHGALVGDALIWRLGRNQQGQERYLLALRPEVENQVITWLRALSDGYVHFDDENLLAMIEGPVVIDSVIHLSEEDRWSALAVQGPKAAALVHGLGHAAWVAKVDLGAVTGRYELLAHPTDVERILAALAEGGAESGDLAADVALRQAANWPAYLETEQGWDAARLYQSHPRCIDLTQPYFVGQSAMRPFERKTLPDFQWEGTESELRRTPLFPSHEARTRKMAPFAGWEMPLWYSSVAEEHQAVRQAAGLFDVAHMGVLEVVGEHATDVLDLVFTNFVRKLRDAKSQYGYLMDPDGHCLDDIMIYRRRWDRYIVVVNAANAEKDLAWLRAVSAGEVTIDREYPQRQADCCVLIRDLQDPSAGQDRLVNIALQGPKSLAILKRVADSDTDKALSHMRRTEFIEGVLADIPAIIARTGYTGESKGYELLVHPDQVAELWERLLEVGAPLGLQPCGLAARDSLRIEAGLPLYGHELAGPLDIGPAAAGFAPYCKFHKPAFIGRSACIEQLENRDMRVVRFQLERSGARAIHQGDPVLSRQGSHIGWVTSCTLIGGVQLGMAFVQDRYRKPGTAIGIVPVPSGRRRPEVKPFTELELGDRVLLHENATVISRFPDKTEREAWRVSA